MKLLRSIALAIGSIAAIPVVVAATGDNNQPFAIIISAPQGGTFKAGKQVCIHVVLTNVSDHIVEVDRSVNPEQAEAYYTIQVHDNDGKDVPETEAFAKSGRRIAFAGSEVQVDLKPGQKVEEDAHLNGQFDLTSPGEYEVQLSRPVSTDPKDGIVRSNRITITVTE